MSENLHKGHKERLRKKLLELDDFSKAPEHEILELLLSYINPRQDTNPIAHRLLNRFGSFYNVLCAQKKELIEIDGIQERTADFLKAQSLFFRLYASQHFQSAHPPVYAGNTFNDDTFLEFLRSLFFGQENQEVFYLFAFDGKRRMIDYCQMFTGSIDAVQIEIRRIVEWLIEKKAVYALCAHNHPKGEAIASQDDLDMTWTIENTLNTLHIILIDHIIYADNHVASVMQDKRFQLMRYKS